MEILFIKLLLLFILIHLHIILCPLSICFVYRVAAGVSCLTDSFLSALFKTTSMLPMSTLWLTAARSELLVNKCTVWSDCSNF